MHLEPFYQFSVAILFAPLLAFALIIFGTRMWDLYTRSRVASVANASLSAHGHSDDLAHGSAADHALDEHAGDDDDDPKVPALTLGARASAWIAMILMAAACVYSWSLLLSSIMRPESLPDAGGQVFSYSWFASYTIAFHIDRLAIVMMVVVTTIALLVMIYSQSYMEKSAGYARFFSYLSLFAFSMLVIVFAENFLVMFIGWELVGLSSYLLIGFWINKKAKPDEQRPSPASASLQAFVTNRIGDVGFIIGIMILFASTGTFNFEELFQHAEGLNQGLLTLAMILVFCGAVGKSAQLPLHTWLPSAMEGPTPVSALIHAATMVAAGVYMVARTYPLFEAAPVALQVVTWTGAITALFAATVALVQIDLKRVLAFSTISQLGYMFVGLGLGGEEFGSSVGMFHLFTHAFFKALLFLGAGSVIHSLHHATHTEMQDMRKMGGLAKYMPITAITWFIAVLAISGFPFFSGFFSKEKIIGLAFEEQNWPIYLITLGTAGLTAFYMLRAYILTFGGPGGKFGGLWGGTYRGEGHPHENPWQVAVPLILLGIPSIVAGYWTGFLTYSNPQIHEGLNIGQMLATPDTWIGVGVSLVGLIVAYVMYCRVQWSSLSNAVQKNAFLSGLHRILFNRYYIDTLYDGIVRYIVLGISHIEQAFDTYVIDGIVNGVGKTVMGFGRGLRRVETGLVQSYMYGFFGGIVVLAVVAIVLVTFFIVKG